MIEGASKEVGIHLVRHPAIKAIAFTGSFAGGTALQKEGFLSFSLVTPHAAGSTTTAGGMPFTALPVGSGPD